MTCIAGTLLCAGVGNFFLEPSDLLFMSLCTGCRYFTLVVLQLLSLFIDANVPRNVTSSVLVSSFFVFSCPCLNLSRGFVEGVNIVIKMTSAVEVMSLRKHR